MLYLGSKIALAVGVKIEVRREHALAMSQDMNRAALVISWDTARAALSVGVKIEVHRELLSPWVKKLRYIESCSSHVPGYG